MIVVEKAGRQFVGVRYSKRGGQVYTYHHDGPDKVRVGDLVKVETARGIVEVEVVELVGAPSFETKPIITRPLEDA